MKLVLTMKEVLKNVKMIQLSKKAGADAIKLQTIDPDLSYAKDTNSYKEFLKLILKMNSYSS